jgi:hypothetical protein
MNKSRDVRELGKKSGNTLVLINNVAAGVTNF